MANTKNLKSKIFGPLEPNFTKLSRVTGIPRSSLVRYYSDTGNMPIGRAICVLKAQGKELKVEDK